MSVADLERRLARAAGGGQPEPQRRRNAVSRYASEREAALASPDTSALRRARLSAAGGAGMSMRALAILAGVSRDSVSRAERGDGRVSDATWRRLATALGRDIEDVRP